MQRVVSRSRVQWHSALERLHYLRCLYALKDASGTGALGVIRSDAKPLEGPLLLPSNCITSLDWAFLQAGNQSTGSPLKCALPTATLISLFQPWIKGRRQPAILHGPVQGHDEIDNSTCPLQAVLISFRPATSRVRLSNVCLSMASPIMSQPVSDAGDEVPADNLEQEPETGHDEDAPVSNNPSRAETVRPEPSTRHREQSASLNGRESPEALPPLDWDDFEARYQKALRDANDQEKDIIKEAESLCKVCVSSYSYL